jgi:hypothetical protein
MLNKIFATDYAGAGRYSPPKCIGAIKNPIMGKPGPGPYQYILCRAPEPHDENVHEALHAIDERLLKEV